MTKHLLCIYNEQSGKNSTAKQDIESAFAAERTAIEFHDIGKGLDTIEKIVKRPNPDMIVAAGGDGTVNAGAKLAIQFDKPLAVLPVGTLNHFAKDMGVPLDLNEAIRSISADKLVAIDYGTVNGQVFVNNSSIGIYPSTVLARDKAHPLLSKWLATSVAFMAALFRNHTLHLRVQYGDQDIRITSPLVFVGNNEYAVEKAGFTTRSNLDRGELFLFAVCETKPIALLHVALLTVFGMVRRKSDVCARTAGPIVLSSRKSHVNVAVDGEVIRLEFPLTYEMHHKKLRVCVA